VLADDDPAHLLVLNPGCDAAPARFDFR